MILVMLKTTTDIAPDKAADLGGKLRQRRKELGLTLEAVARRAGVTTGFVSQVERNITSPSLSSLIAMTEALDAHITDFFDPPPKPDETSRAEMREIYASPGGGFDFERLSTSFPGSRLNGLLVHHPPGFTMEEMMHEGEEFYLVMKGALTLVVDGVRTVLGVGDSIHFDSMRPHAVQNETGETVTVLVVNTMDLFGEERGEGKHD
ncbi:MAG: helix-turn-helix domain-containing protein [Geminicoccaceae bacterium]